MLWNGAAIAVAGLLTVLPLAFGADEVGEVVDVVLIGLITALPFAFLVGLMRSSLSRAGAVTALFERLGGADARDALAEALGDESLALAYWLPESGRYVDARGQTVALPEPGGDRAVTEIERDGAPVAAIVHDPALLEERELVRTAGAAAALALENERLAAEVRARYDDLRGASARLVAAGDAARRRIERDLHDGAQQRLVSLSLTLNLARRHADPGSQTARAARRRDRRADGRAVRAARARPRHPSRRADRARPRPCARRARRPRAAPGDDLRAARAAAPAGRRGRRLLRRHRRR